MKTLRFISKTTFILFLIISCENSDSNLDVPTCIEEKINHFKTEEVKNPPTQVWEWKVDNDTYYYITSDCCDQFNYLYDINCILVCAPDGGITGSGDGECPDFNKSIKKTLIWQDPRK